MTEAADLTVYAGLFLMAVAAATVLPLQSEAALVGLLLSESYPTWLLLTVASAGNTVGAVINWLLGRSVDRFRHKRWFPVREAALERARGWYRRYGRWSLLLSWLPIVGDPLTIAAGAMGERFWVFLTLVGLAKTGRYLVLAGLTLSWV